MNMIKNVPRRNAIKKPTQNQRPETGAISTNQPMGYEQWLSMQPYGGQISPFEPQGNDYWQEEYNNYLMGWFTKFQPWEFPWDGFGNDFS